MDTFIGILIGAGVVAFCLTVVVGALTIVQMFVDYFKYSNDGEVTGKVTEIILPKKD